MPLIDCWVGVLMLLMTVSSVEGGMNLIDTFSLTALYLDWFGKWCAAKMEFLWELGAQLRGNVDWFVNNVQGKGFRSTVLMLFGSLRVRCTIPGRRGIRRFLCLRQHLWLWWQTEPLTGLDPLPSMRGFLSWLVCIFLLDSDGLYSGLGPFTDVSSCFFGSHGELVWLLCLALVVSCCV